MTPRPRSGRISETTLIGDSVQPLRADEGVASKFDRLVKDRLQDVFSKAELEELGFRSLRTRARTTGADLVDNIPGLGTRLAQTGIGADQAVLARIELYVGIDIGPSSEFPSRAIFYSRGLP